VSLDDFVLGAPLSVPNVSLGSISRLWAQPFPVKKNSIKASCEPSKASLQAVPDVDLQRYRVVGRGRQTRSCPSPRNPWDCPEQDAGFSPLNLAWALRSMPVDRLALALGWLAEHFEAPVWFNQVLIEQVLEQACPD
jgi:hypothetical protein